jgi:hypothetical protein
VKGKEKINGVIEPPKNVGFTASRSIGGFSAKRECTNTHQAYKTMIKVEVKLLQFKFKIYKTLKQKVLQKIEHISGSVHLDDTRAFTSP